MAYFSECHLAVNYAYKITSIAARKFLLEIQIAVVMITGFSDKVVQRRRRSSTISIIDEAHYCRNTGPAVIFSGTMG